MNHSRTPDNDLISRKHVIVELKKARDRHPKLQADGRTTSVFDAATRSGIREARHIVENAPSVDAALVRHAVWRQKKMSVPKGKGQTYLMWGCSSCHNHEKKRSPYCPNCGAKMDAEVQG